MMERCELCPVSCKSRRLNSERGRCGLSDGILYSHTLAHFGEEPPITGKHGSGTVFLSGCNARCLFCQNYQISQLHMGKTITPDELAGRFLHLQEQGCTNINWVTPTPQLPMLLDALSAAVARGLTIPLVYNSNGYVKTEIIQALEGIVDIYLPDMKYGEDLWAESLSSLVDYTSVNRKAVLEMVRQTGPLAIDESGKAVRGVLVRHLVLPEGISGYRKIFRVLSDIDPHVPLSLMGQYRPCHLAVNHPLIGRALTDGEYRQAIDAFEDSGLISLFAQDALPGHINDSFFPDFGLDESRVFDHS